MIRTLHPELVDNLPADHPGAIQSRRDLRRLNLCMGHAGILAREVKSVSPQKPLTITEIGAGDGELLLRIAQRLRGNWPSADATLIDLQDLLQENTRAQFLRLNWRVRSVESDVFKWLEAAQPSDVILANLFLHHFSDEQLKGLLLALSAKTNAVIALEPRRTGWPLFWTRWLHLIGCGPVTCHDAHVSVRAGFRDHELSALWPDRQHWSLIERRAGLFSHLFVARRC